MPLTASAISTWSYLIIQRSICPVEYSSSWGALLCLGSLVAKTNWSVVHWMFQSRNCNCLLYNALLAHSLGFHSTHSPVKYSQNQYQSDFAQYLPIKITSFSHPHQNCPFLHQSTVSSQSTPPWNGLKRIDQVTFIQCTLSINLSTADTRCSEIWATAHSQLCGWFVILSKLHTLLRKCIQQMYLA